MVEGESLRGLANHHEIMKWRGLVMVVSGWWWRGKGWRRPAKYCHFSLSFVLEFKHVSHYLYGAEAAGVKQMG